jgi:hypothetical protein
MSNYPKRFEILQNDGKTLECCVDKLTNSLNEYFIKHFINDKVQGESKDYQI